MFNDIWNVPILCPDFSDKLEKDTVKSFPWLSPLKVKQNKR